MSITHDEHDTEFIARDGMVIDKNYMQIGPGEQRASIGKHHTHLTMYLHLLPIFKKNLNANITPFTSGTIRNSPDYQENVLHIDYFLLVLY